MGFTGNLQTLPISEVLTLVLSSEKTGILTCNSEDQAIKFHFLKGQIIKIEKSDQELLFGALLIKRKLISTQDLSYALQLQKDAGKRIGEIMVELSMLRKEYIDVILYFQLEETFFSIVEWEAGLFGFDEMSPNELATPLPSPYEKIDMPKFLKSLSEKAKEFRNLADQIPPSSSKLSLFVRLEELDSEMLENPEIMEIIQLSDGTRTLAAIRRAFSMGILKAQRLIFSLYLKDILKAVSTSGTIGQRKIYESVEEEAEGIKEILTKIFPPCFEEIQKIYKTKIGPKYVKIFEKKLGSVSKKYPELFANSRVAKIEDIDLNAIFKSVNIKQDSSWFHTVFSMLSSLLTEFLVGMKGVLGKVQVDKIVDELTQKIDLHLEENKHLSDKYNLGQSMERLVSQFTKK